MNRITAGYLFLTLAQVALSCNVVMGKYLGQVMPVFTYVGCRFFVSSLILGILKVTWKVPLVGPEHCGPILKKKYWLYLILQALSAGFLFNYLFFMGIQYTTATSAGVIASTLPAILTIMAWLILRERISHNKIVSVMICIAGILVLSLDNSDNPASAAGEGGSYLGDTIVFLAMIPEAWYSILSRQLKGQVTSLGCAFVVNLFSLLMTLPFMIKGFQEVPLSSWTSSTYLMIIAGGVFSAIFFICWSKGLEVIEASTAAIFGGIVPVATALLAILFLDESPTMITFTGMALVIFSLWWGSVAFRKRQVQTSR